MLVAEQPLAGEHRRVLAERLAVHDQVLPVHVDLDVGDALHAQLVDDVQRHADVAHQDLHRGLAVLVLQEQLPAVLRAHLRGLADRVDEPAPAVGVGRLERVVVALDAGPEHEVRAQRAGEVGALERQAQGLGARGRIGIDEPAAAEARIQVEAGAERVDPVPGERRAHLVEIVGRELVGVVELVVVDQVAEARDGAVHLLGGGRVREAGLVADGHEARDHRAEGPDAEAGLDAAHAQFPWLEVRTARRGERVRVRDDIALARITT